MGRVEARGGGVVNAPSEARMRMESRGGGVVTAPSEARIRAGDSRGTAYTEQSEARLRAGQTSQAGVNVPSDARMRLAEHRGTPNKYDIKPGSGYSQSPIGSLTANLTVATVNKISPTVTQEHQVP